MNNTKRLAILFDIDGTLIISGGAFDADQLRAGHADRVIGSLTEGLPL